MTTLTTWTIDGLDHVHCTPYIFWMHIIEADHADNPLITWTTWTTLTNWSALTTLTDQRFINKIFAEFALFAWSSFYLVFSPDSFKAIFLPSSLSTRLPFAKSWKTGGSFQRGPLLVPSWSGCNSHQTWNLSKKIRDHSFWGKNYAKKRIIRDICWFATNMRKWLEMGLNQWKALFITFIICTEYYIASAHIFTVSA